MCMSIDDFGMVECRHGLKHSVLIYFSTCFQEFSIGMSWAFSHLCSEIFNITLSSSVLPPIR